MDYDPFSKSQLASMQLTSGPYLVQIWSRSPQHFEAHLDEDVLDGEGVRAVAREHRHLLARFRLTNLGPTYIVWFSKHCKCQTFVLGTSYVKLNRGSGEGVRAVAREHRHLLVAFRLRLQG